MYVVYNKDFLNSTHRKFATLFIKKTSKAKNTEAAAKVGGGGKILISSICDKS